MPRHKGQIKAGPQLSQDAGDKVTACLNWYVARNKRDPKYLTAPSYYDAVLKWRKELSAANEDLMWNVITVATAPRHGGERSAEQYAAELPPVPKPPRDLFK